MNSVHEIHIKWTNVTTTRCVLHRCNRKKINRFSEQKNNTVFPWPQLYPQPNCTKDHRRQWWKAVFLVERSPTHQTPTCCTRDPRSKSLLQRAPAWRSKCEHLNDSSRGSKLPRTLGFRNVPQCSLENCSEGPPPPQRQSERWWSFRVRNMNGWSFYTIYIDLLYWLLEKPESARCKPMETYSHPPFRRQVASPLAIPRFLKAEHNCRLRA